MFVGPLMAAPSLEVVLWLITALCVVGRLAVAWVVAKPRGCTHGAENLDSLGWLMVVCVVGASGAQLVNALASP